MKRFLSSFPSLSTPKKHRKIGIIFGWRDPALGAYKAAEQFDVSLVACFSRHVNCSLPELWMEKNLDGYIFVCPDEEMLKVAEQLYSEGIAVNVILRSSNKVPTISADTQGAIAQMVDYFASQGHKDILFITGTQNEQGRTRLQGYLDGLTRNNLPLNQDLIIDFGQFMSEDTDFKSDVIKQFFDREIPFSAAVLGGRWAILGLLNAAADHGYNIPNDFVAFTLDDPCEFPGVKEWFSHSPLPAYELGWEAVKNICDQLDKQVSSPLHLNISCPMVIRSSCGGCRDLENAFTHQVATTPKEQLQQCLRKGIPNFFQSIAEEIPDRIWPSIRNSLNPSLAVFNLILEIENYGIQFDQLPYIASIIKDHALQMPNADSQEIDSIFDQVFDLLSDRIQNYKNPKHQEFPGLTRIERFFPKVLGKTHTLSIALDELKRQLSNRGVTKLLLKLDPLDFSEEKRFIWEKPQNKSDHSQVEVLSSEGLHPLSEYTEITKRTQAIFLDFNIEEQGKHWIYLELEGENYFNNLEILLQFGTGYRTFMLYANQQRNSRELQQAKRTADFSKEQAAEALKIAQSAHYTKTNFLAGISHEIRTPMNSIVGLTELLLETELTEQQNNQLTMVQNSVTSLLAIIDEILNFSSIEAGQLVIEKTEFDLRDLISNLTKNIALRAEEKGLELLCRIQSTIPEQIVGDPNRIRQILLNLVGNAIKFTGEGQVLLNVTQKDSTKDKIVIQFTVKDTGIGIPSHQRDHIFESFEQADTSTTRRYGGTGLGLTICKRLIEQMHGTLSIESTEGIGSTFSFPLEFSLPSSQTLPAPLPSPESELTDMKILIIESNTESQRILTEMSEEWNLDADTADNALMGFGQVMKAHVAKDQYDLLLIDAQLPGINGYNLIQQIKESETFDGPILVMIPSSTSSDTVASYNELNIAGFVTKPIAANELKEALEKSISINKPIKRKKRRPAVVEKPAEHPLQILLAEDNEVNVEVVRGYLEKRGHSIHHVENGLDATNAFRQKHFDLILMDIQMPKMDGLTATRLIRDIEKGDDSNIRIVAMTARAMKSDEEECLNSGMDGYVSKPFSKNALIDAVEKDDQSV